LSSMTCTEQGFMCIEKNRLDAWSISDLDQISA